MANAARPRARWFPRLMGAGLALALLAGPGAAQPEPTVPKPQGYVFDAAGVIDPGTRARLEALIGELDRKTGAQIAVVVVRSTRPLTAFDYAMRIAEAWRPGSREKDNGVVFLVAVADRELFILTGYGVESILPDGKVGEIRDRSIVPEFRRGDYARGIWEGTAQIARIIASDAGVQLATLEAGTGPAGSDPTTHGPQHVGAEPNWLDAAIGLFVLLMLLTFMVQFQPRRGRVRWYGGYRGGFGGGGAFGRGGFGGFGGGGFGGGGAGGRW